ncbi:putative ring finger domain protein [Golovinomyces cichoracearum]|uniref:Putative ring finger domain protein n=1 Tax=Golovinomyces cichoracearum TaxID=62708 RepID=A0A420J1U8_9PEZI|nr:putative ring finger domain protein [Golovinomyces cichoracearum]
MGSTDIEGVVNAEKQSFPSESVSNETINSHNKTRYATRTCRICLEEVHPTSDVPNENFSALFHPSPKVKWISEDPTSGRLIRPCLCKGSQRYVHEGCLQLWRYADPALLQRNNFWKCPTCKFEYRLERMKWSRLIINPTVRIGITFVVMLIATFTLGFIADPIINFYTNPLNTLATISTEGKAALYIEEENSSWTKHFLKGFVSIGVFGIAKTTLAMSSWQWIFRGFGVRTYRRRDQHPNDVLSGIPWIVIIFGAVTFLIAVWRFVQAWTNSVLEKAGESVADVQSSDDEEEENNIEESELLNLPTKISKS